MQAIFDERQLRHAPAVELHNGAWTEHAETPRRAQAIVRALEQVVPARDHGLAPILRIHGQDYLDFLRSAHGEWVGSGRTGDAIGYAWPVVGRRPVRLQRIDARLGQFSYDASTPIAEGTWEGAYWSAQTALSALQIVLDGAERASFALCRPPGHHCGADYLGGYCYLNNAAIAAQAAVDAGRRVAILDIDYHHGNGTQDIFLEREDVLFVSIHADPATDYPFFWGHGDETGVGAGKGKTLNLPLPRGTGCGAYLDALRNGLSAVRAHGADLLVLSFGADTYEGDPISHFKLKTQDYTAIAEEIAAIGLPTLIVMEGGYAVDALGRNVSALLSGFSRNL